MRRRDGVGADLGNDWLSSLNLLKNPLSFSHGRRKRTNEFTGI